MKKMKHFFDRFVKFEIGHDQDTYILWPLKLSAHDFTENMIP